MVPWAEKGWKTLMKLLNLKKKLVFKVVHWTKKTGKKDKILYMNLCILGCRFVIAQYPITSSLATWMIHFHC